MKLRSSSVLHATAIVSALICMGTGLGVITAAPAAAALEVCNGTGIAAAGNESVATIPGRKGVGTTCRLSEGDSGEAVTTLQATLNRCYNAGLQVDGKFGPRTKSALQRAQGTAGAGVDGVYGPETRDKLRWHSRMHDTDKGCNRLT
ncbi:peptidoglycan-binding domain-containing protein [Nocardia sp. NPDC051787]|uniref:peptidoglycan-binding domain-containing protein n=1 Tax=Nocardia sp. NPDC051787 TaxID=3155415 RepID=UPI00344AC8A5